MSKNTKENYKLGIACESSLMKNPYLMWSYVYAEDYQQAKQAFLNNPYIRSDKSNDTVMVLSVGSPINKKDQIYA